MWKSIGLFLSGVVAAFIAFFAIKGPEIQIIKGDLIESQKIKDNRKYKNIKPIKGLFKKTRQKWKDKRISRRELKNNTNLK